MKFRVAVALASALFASAVSAYPIAVGDCYTIDGPANLRDKPGGKVVSSLNNGSRVRVVDGDRGAWYLVEYASEKTVSNCRFDGAEKGWTHFTNLLPEGRPLAELAREEKVMYADSEIDLYGSDSARFLGKEYPIDCGDETAPCRLTIPQPFEITVHCLSGRSHRARVSRVDLYYGGDQDAWLTDIVFQGNIPAEGCVIVDGAIGRSGAAVGGKSENICSKCRENIVTDGHEMACSYRVGDFENDGIREAIVHTATVQGAPSYDRRDLFQMKTPCEGVALGNVYRRSIP